jgi:flagellar basal-body rod protein FlgB
MKLFDATSAALDRALGAAGLRQQVLANNLSNVNTPGFKRSDVDFEGALAKAMDGAKNSDDTSPFDDLTPAVATDDASTMRADGNNVDVDREMAGLAENNVKYNALVQIASKRMKMLEMIVSDGRR